MDLTRSLHQRLGLFPDLGEMRDGKIRYLMMRPDVLMGMFAALPAGIRAQALDALAASVALNGGKSVQVYRDSGAAEPGQMMRTIVATSAELGWGLWRFDVRSETLIEVSVDNSPFATAAGFSDMPACAAIRGMLTAIAALLMPPDRPDAPPPAVGEVSCHAMTGSGPCRFTIRAVPD